MALPQLHALGVGEALPQLPEGRVAVDQDQVLHRCPTRSRRCPHPMCRDRVRRFDIPTEDQEHVVAPEVLAPVLVEFSAALPSPRGA
jgi:hypothetical protein